MIHFRICLVGRNPAHLIKSNVLRNDIERYCRQDKWCQDGNRTFVCPLFASICNKTNSDLCSTDNEYVKDVRIEQGVPGLKNWQLSGQYNSIRHIRQSRWMYIFYLENLFSHYRAEGEVESGVKGDSTFEVVAQELTSFLILVGIYFPSVTGNKSI